MRIFNRFLSLLGRTARRLVVVAALLFFFAGQFLGWWDSPSLVNVNVNAPQLESADQNQVSPPETKSKIWTSTRELTAEENAAQHFRKHGDEFPFSSQSEYVAAAIKFVSVPPEGTRTVVQSDGDHVYYNEKLNYFAVTNRRGVLRTFFRPDPRIHGYPSNLEYFRAQEQK